MKRIEWVDTLRGFCIFCIVLGHTLSGMGIGAYKSVLGSIIVTFWLPLFFFISGFFSYKKDRPLRDRIKELKPKFIHLIIPAVVFVTIYSVAFKESMFVWIYRGFGPYWFTEVLFLFIAVNVFLSPLDNRKYDKLYDISLILISFLAIIVLIEFRNNSWGWNFFCMENATKYFQFFAFGILSRKYSCLFYKALDNKYFIGGAILFCSLSLLIYFGKAFEGIPYYVFNFNRDIIIRYLAVIVLLIYFSKNDVAVAEKPGRRYFNRIGKISLDIYLIHWFFLPRLVIPGITDDKIFIIQLFVASAIAYFIVKICEVVSSTLRFSDFISRYALGVKNNK